MPQSKLPVRCTIACTLLTLFVALVAMGMAPSKDELRNTTMAVQEPSAQAPDHLIAHIELVRIDLDETTRTTMNQSGEPIDINRLTSQSIKNGTATLIEVQDIPVITGHEFNTRTSTKKPYRTGKDCISYERCGTSLQCSTQREGDRINAQWHVCYSDMQETNISISEGIPAQQFIAFEQEFATSTKPGQVTMASIGSIESSKVILVMHVVFQKT